MEVDRDVLIPVEDKGLPSLDGYWHGNAIMATATDYSSRTGLSLTQLYAEEIASDDAQQFTLRVIGGRGPNQ